MCIDGRCLYRNSRIDEKNDFIRESAMWKYYIYLLDWTIS